MSDDLNTEIKIGADASGVEAGVGRAKRSLADLGASAQKAGKDAAAGVAGVGAGGDKAAKDVERATRSMQSSLQRLLAEQKAGAKGSREYWEALADTRGISRNSIKPILDQLDAAKSKTLQAKAATESWQSGLSRIGPLVAAAFSGVAISSFIGKVVAVQREFDVLNSSLKTVTGSSAAAEREMAWLKDFAKETPFGLAQATQGFVKMKALGLDPTRAALTSFGNTASAMGKDLNQMIEAVADASTGEFERLKEFGIKAKKEGDQVSLTFQGVTTTIQNSAAEITKYLENIGNTSFGGAMEERAKTLDGTIAALGDTWDELFRTVSTNNVGSLIFDSVTLANGALEDATTLLRAMGGAAQDASRDTGALSTIQNGIATVFETVAVLGANLKYVLVGIGTEIGGLAAQVAQAAQFNFAGVRAIREQMVADAEAARREIDATTERILNARKAQEEYARYATRNASAATDPRRVDLGGSTTRAAGGASSGAAKAVKETISEYDKLIQKLGQEIPKAAAEAEAAQMGYNKAQTEFLALAASPAWAKFTNDQRATVAALFANKIASEDAADAAKTLAKANLDAAASREKYLTSLSSGLDKIQADIAAQIEATERMGLSKEAIAELDAAKLEMLATDLELQAIKAMDRNLDQQTYDALMAQAKAYRELGNAKRAGAARETAVEEAKKAADEWQRTSEQINSSLTDALMRGFESGKDFAKNMRDTIVNMFKTMVLRPVISAVLSPISGALTGMMGLAGTANAATGAAGVGGLGGILNAGSNIYSALTNGISGSISSAFSTFAGSGVGQSLGLSNSAAIMGNNPSAFVPAGGQLTSLGSSVGAGLGMLGSGLAGYGISSMLSGGYSAGKGVNAIAGIASAIPGIGPIAGVIGGLINRAFGRKLKDSGIEGTLGGAAGFEGSAYDFYKGGWLRSDKTKYKDLDPTVSKGLSDAFKSIQAQVGTFATVLGLNADKVASFTTQLKFSTKGLDEAGTQAAIAEALAKGSNELAEQVLGTWTSVTKEVTEVIQSGHWDSGLAIAEVTRTVTESTYAASEYAKEGEKAIDTLTRLATNLSTVNGAFDVLGLTLYESSLAGADMASRLADAFGGLENLTSAVGVYYDNFYSEAEKAANVTRDITAALADVGLEMPKTREDFRALVESQMALGDAGMDAVAALLKVSGAFASVTAESETAAAAAARLADEQRKSEEAAARAAEEAARRAEEIARERYGLETQLMQLLGDTAGLRKREIEALDASNRALQNHIYAIEDARAAYEKSITAAQSAYSVLESSVGRERSVLQSALDAEREAITARYKLQQDGHAAQLSAAQSAADKMRGIASMLSGALGRMVVESPALDRARLQSARGVIGAAAASSNVMAPGLEAALSVVTSDVRKLYGKWEDFAFDRGVTAGQTAALSSAAQSQLSGYESIVNALKAQDDVAKLLADAELAAAQERFDAEMKKLDERLEQGKSMLDRLLGIEEGTLSSVEALARLTDAVNASNAAMQAQRAAEAAARAAVSAGAPGKASGIESALWAAQESAIVERLNDAEFLKSIGLDAGNLEAALADAAFWAANGSGQSQSTLLSDALGRIGGMDGYAVVSAAVEAIRGSGSLLYDNDAINFSGSGYHDAEKMRELERLLGVHGSHAGGLAYVPFDGYRAELHKGERVLTQDEARVYTPPAVVASMLRSGGASDGEILAELRAMRQRLEAIEAAANATAGATVGTKRTLDRVVDSDALRTRETP